MIAPIDLDALMNVALVANDAVDDWYSPNSYLGKIRQADRNFIAAASPIVVLGIIADLRAALAEKPLGPTIAELQSAGALPAFPQMARAGELAVSEGGLSMRDYFATRAMGSILSSDSLMAYSDQVVQTTDRRRDEWVAEQAYAFADAMLVARATP